MFAWFVWPQKEIGRAVIMEIFGPNPKDCGKSRFVSMMKNSGSAVGMPVCTMPFPG